MALVATASTADPRAQSIGPRKMQILTLVAQSADVSGTVTASNLYLAEQIIVDGLKLTAAPTFSGNVVTLAFADPAAAIYATCIVMGK